MFDNVPLSDFYGGSIFRHRRTVFKPSGGLLGGPSAVLLSVTLGKRRLIDRTAVHSDRMHFNGFRLDSIILNNAVQ